MLTLVLLPGMDGTGRLFAPLLEQLGGAVRTQVMAYDNTRGASYEALVDRVRRNLPRNGCVLLAESFAGPVAWQLAVDPPPGLKGVIFAASFIEPPRPRLLRIAHRLGLGRLARAPWPGVWVRALLLGRDAPRALIETFTSVLRSVPPSVLEARLKNIATLDSVSTRAVLPCVYIRAGADRLVPPSSLAVFRRMSDKLSVHEVEGPHFILQANPDACARIIRDALGRWDVPVYG